MGVDAGLCRIVGRRIALDSLWGDEIEYLLVRLDRSTKSARLLLVAHDLLLKLSHLDDHFKSKVVFHPEYGQFMVETTPGTPYGGFTTHLPLVESNMLLRRHLIHVSGEAVVCLSLAHPLLDL